MDWKSVDAATLALSLNCSLYQQRLALHNAALGGAIAAALQLSTAAQVQITGVRTGPQWSPAAGSCMVDVTVLGPAALANTTPTLSSLFNVSSPGSPARDPLLASLAAAGLRAASPRFVSGASPPPPPLAAYTFFTQNQQVEFRIPLERWQRHAIAYVPAVSAAIADAMGIDVSTIWVIQVTPSSQGKEHGCVVWIDFSMPEKSSESDGTVSVPVEVIGFAALFGQGDGWTTVPGNNATPAFLASLHKYGLPVAEAFYMESPPAPPPPAP